MIFWAHSLWFLRLIIVVAIAVEEEENEEVEEEAPKDEAEIQVVSPIRTVSLSRVSFRLYVFLFLEFCFVIVGYDSSELRVFGSAI